MMRKIFIEKAENTQSIALKVQAQTEKEVVLVIPRAAAIKESVNNFRTLKKEAEAAGKVIMVESVDDEVLALAENSGLEAIHPFFHNGARSNPSLTDIRHAKGQEAADEEAEEEKSPRRGKKAEEKKTVNLAPPVQPAPAPTSEIPAASAKAVPAGPAAPSVSPKEGPTVFIPAIIGPAAGLRRPRRLALLAIGAGLVAFILIVLTFGFAWANVNVHLKKFEWNAPVTITVDKTAGTVNADAILLPGELFEQKKNFSQAFPGSVKRDVSQKATGRITIFNEFSAAPQQLVATTRFVAGDGKIYRLVKGVTVPGAKVSGDTVTAASIEADIVADQPGPDYNRGEGERLSIPGFQGTPRYEKFYGIMKSVSGGFIGEKLTASDADVEKAKQQVSEILKSGLVAEGLNSRPEGLKILDNAAQVEITKLNVNQETDDKGNFMVFGEASMRAVAFREEDLKTLMEELANRQLSPEGPRLAFRDFQVSFDQVRPNFGNGMLQFQATANGMLAADFSAPEFAAKLKGLHIDEARALTGTIPGLDNANISVWPFWVSRLPASESRINLTVD